MNECAKKKAFNKIHLRYQVLYFYMDVVVAMLFDLINVGMLLVPLPLQLTFLYQCR